MSFKYINPGYAELLSVSGGTTVTGEQYSKTGISFWQPSYKKGLDLSEVPAEFYAKFDVYLKNIKNGSSAEVEIYIGDRNGLNLQAGRWGRGVTGYTETSIVFNKFDVDTNIRIDAINTVWLHIKPGNNADGIMHVMINEYEIYNKRNLNIWYVAGAWAKNITVYSKNDGAYISSLILSDEEISPREQVIMLPVQSIQTNMTDCRDGSYEATAANQEILQTVDVAALSAQYGADSRVTGISLIGNPAHRTAEGLCALTALEKSGGNITEYGRHIAEQNPNSTVMDTRTVSMTIEELTGRQFGWRART